MTYSEMISQIQTEINKVDIDTELQRFIQDAIDFLYSANAWRNLEKTKSLTITKDVETVAVPADFGEVSLIRFPLGSGKHRNLIPVSPVAFVKEQESLLGTETEPMVAMLWDELLYFYPIPVANLAITLFQRIGYTSIYEHNLTLTDDNNAASAGVAVYFDEDGGTNGEGKLLFISPTTTNAIVEFEDGDGHVHLLTIYHEADAATKGKAWYFDEDGSGVDNRNLFISPTNTDGYVGTEITNRHSHFLGFRDRDSAASLGVQVYCDEDDPSKTDRLLFVSPTNIDGTTKIIHGPDRQIPPFLEPFQVVIRLLAVSYAWRWRKDYAAMAQVEGQALKMLAKIVGA